VTLTLDAASVRVMGDVTSNELLKRKRTSSSSDFEDVDDDEDDQRLRRRVLELSLAKVRTAAPLTRSLRRREPALLRSVLILNTLRAVDAAARTLLDPTLCGDAAAAAMAPSTPYRSPSVLDELPGSLLRPPTPDRAAADDDDDAAISAILDDLFGGGEARSSPPPPPPPPPPVLTFSSLFDLDCASVWPPPPLIATPVAVTSPSSSSSSSLDVDLDLDDFDLLQPLTPAAAVVGCVAGSRTVGAAASVAGSPSAAVLACTERSQCFVDELEHMAQVLVGT